ncbi:MAG: protein-L-isoaspartate(D-aspartate) O-methyltransferase [Kiritimatiellia bacterium]|nr:protein-L-isoaspartate(D-aspartate) O-methyltransferase [Lentisphaerota bacterium]
MILQDFLMLSGAAIALCCIGACQAAEPIDPAPAPHDGYAESRARMIRQLRDYGIKNQQILNVMARLPRHLFIPAAMRDRSDPYGDHPCPIGHNQTISQPYIVAYMTEKLEIQPDEKILEIGTGSGYQAAILAALGAQVFSIEIIPELAEHARTAVKDQSLSDVQILTGDGYQGWPEHAPFDAIIVTCAPENIPPRLVEQLRDGGRMIVPVGRYSQRLVLLRKRGSQLEITEDLPVRFVPMVPGS